MKSILAVLLFIAAIASAQSKYQYLGELSSGKVYLDLGSVKPIGTNTEFKVYKVYSSPKQAEGVSAAIASDAVLGVLDCNKGMVFSGSWYGYDAKGLEVASTKIDRWIQAAPNTIFGLVAKQYCH